jgi:hypothetical protein
MEDCDGFYKQVVTVPQMMVKGNRHPAAGIASYNRFFKRTAKLVLVWQIGFVRGGDGWLVHPSLAQFCQRTLEWFKFAYAFYKCGDISPQTV